jgi:hypothetical protein
MREGKVSRRAAAMYGAHDAFSGAAWPGRTRVRRREREATQLYAKIG